MRYLEENPRPSASAPGATADADLKQRSSGIKNRRDAGFFCCQERFFTCSYAQ